MTPSEEIIQKIFELLPSHPTVENLKETEDLRNVPATEIREALHILETRGKVIPREMFGRG
jgi:hypothetical protein